MKKLLYSILFCNVLALNGYSQSVTRLLATSPNDDQLRILDTSNYSLIVARTMSLSSGTFNGSNGLARKPTNGIFYMVVKTGTSRYLSTLNPITGSVTIIGDLQDNFAQITFNGNNTLLGVTGTGATNPNAVYRINVVNANKTFINNVNGAFGQAICYNPTNNKVYQWTGGYPYQYTRYDTTFVSSSNVPPVNSTYEVTGAVYKSNGKFVTFDLSNDFLKTDTVGNNDNVGTYNQVLKGLAYITCSRTITASSPSVCANSAVTLSMSSTPGATMQWYKNNVAVAGATNATLASIGPGYFKCMIEDGCGMDSLAAGKNIILLPTPVVSITGTNTICQGASTQLVGSSGGASQWYKNGVLLTGANSNTLTVTTAGVYNMIKTNLNGCADSAATGKVMTVLQSPTVSISISPSAVCAGNSATITAAGAVTFSWSTGATLTSSIVVSPLTTTGYTATGYNLSGCSNFTVIALNVNALPSVSVSASSMSICVGESATLSALGANVYTWSSSSNAASIIVAPVTSTGYTLTGTDVNGCTNSSSILLDVDLCTGIQVNTANTTAVKIYPNPSSGDITIESHVAMGSLEVMDVTGRIVLRRSVLNANTCELDLTTLNAGIYNLRINQVSGNVSNSKITLNK